ncbi:DUF3169 family protein [Staphylococcus sp. Marseille-Q5304]|uniref:DUF3169 family protein n=1 Tax=Staphylococcus sp. Marseille-Q5304 TaxID=2942200 RepID=UPI00207360CB|nr:DUF3169 family protein [Staphylococcus sp. Marseille-Q5304]
MKVGRYLMMVLFGGIVGGIIGGLIGVSENINLLDRNNFANHHYVSIVSTIGIVINICLMIALFFVQKKALSYKRKIDNDESDTDADLYERKANIELLKSNFITYLSIFIVILVVFLVAIGNSTNDSDQLYMLLPNIITVIPSVMYGFFIQKFDSRYPKLGEKNYTEKTLYMMDEGERHIALVSMYKIYTFNIIMLMAAGLLLGIFSLRTNINQAPGLLIILILFCYNTFGYIFKIRKFYK